MPIVRQAVTRLFGRFPATHLNPDEAVALGAGVQAGLRARDVDLREVVLTDVCPYSLGVDTGEKMPDGSIRSGLFTPIIERNTIVPASRIRRFFNLADGQADVKFGVYQGEARFVSDNILLGTVRVPIPPGPAGTIAVDCRFTYDINGLLEVDVLVPGTGERRELVIHDSDSSVKPEELAARRQALAALKVHPRDMDANRAVLARLQRCYEEALGADREQIGHVIVQFEAVLEHQDPREIEQARAKVTELLDRRDGGNYL
jgi:molecular chaperone HscC